MQGFTSMLNAVRETPVLRLSRETIQVLWKVLQLSEYHPSPLRNLKLLFLQGLDDMLIRSTDHVIDYLLSNSPCAGILQGHHGGNQKLQKRGRHMSEFAG
ncbi:hypothetical protein AgCh_032146 [Apium graveolens]